MILHWSQITVLVLSAISFGITLTRFGEQKHDSYDFTDLIVAPALMLWLLWCGGFFG